MSKISPKSLHFVPVDKMSTPQINISLHCVLKCFFLCIFLLSSEHVSITSNCILVYMGDIGVITSHVQHILRLPTSHIQNLLTPPTSKYVLWIFRGPGAWVWSVGNNIWGKNTSLQMIYTNKDNCFISRELFGGRDITCIYVSGLSIWQPVCLSRCRCAFHLQIWYLP